MIRYFQEGTSLFFFCQESQLTLGVDTQFLRSTCFSSMLYCSMMVNHKKFVRGDVMLTGDVGTLE